VIPQILNHTGQNVIGKPFIRAYANILAQYSMSQESFLAFLDELNINQIGHISFQYIRQAGTAIHLAGHLDPTGITKLVGSSVKLTASLSELAYVKGPFSKKNLFLNRANKDVFNPRGLKVCILSGKELRKLLGMDIKFPLCAPLMTDWVVPTKELLLKGQRSAVRVANRQMYQLLPRVHELTLAEESNEALLTDGSLGSRKAAQQVKNWQVRSEVEHQIWRGEALALYNSAEAAVTKKEKVKLEKKSKSRDKEFIHTQKINWLVICNLDDMPEAAPPTIVSSATI
jgi:hypothetical protein